MNTFSWLVWLAAALVVLSLTNNPLYLLVMLLVVTLVFVACRDARPLAQAYRLFFVAGFALWLGYVLFSVVTVGGGRGSTVLVTLPRLTLPPLLGGITFGGPVAAEDLAWGATRGLRLWALVALFGAFNALVDHYRLLRMTPRSLFHAGLVVTIALTFVPQLVRSLLDIREAQHLRGHRFRGLRSYVALVSPLLASSLERSIQLAEALDARGYGRTQAGTYAIARYQLTVIGGILLLGAGVFAWLYYGRPTLVPSALLGATGAALFAVAARGLGRLVPRTTYRRERWRRRDTLANLAAAACALGWAALRAWDSGLVYTPYPILSAPPFSLLAGAALLLLLAPALAGAPAPLPRRRDQRQARATRSAPSMEAEPGNLRLG